MKVNRFWILMVLAILAGCNTKKKEEEPLNSGAKKEELALDLSTELPFTVYDYEGLEPLLNRKDDKTYIVNFWATWCKPCLEEMPYFQKTFEERKTHGVELILVSLDMPSMWAKRLVPYVEKKNLQGEIVILDDPKMNEWIPKIAQNWGGGIPATLIYNQNKRAFYEKGFTYEELNTELKKFVP